MRRSARGRRSLRAEMTRTFLGFGGLLVLAYVALAMVSAIEQEDSLLKRQLAIELAAYWQRHCDALRTDAPAPIWVSPALRAYVGAAQLPTALRDATRDLSDGIYEIERPGLISGGGSAYFVAIRSASDQRRLYLVYDARQLDEWNETRAPLLRSILLGTVLVGGLSALMAARLSRRLIAPLVDLENALTRHTEPSALAQALAERDDPPELATLADALRRAMHRIDGFVARERRFTRNASHELRTPVTVIRGATELLEDEHDPARQRQVHDRIRRAVDDMEQLIETFLWLAREETADDGWQTALAPVVEAVAASHRPLLDRRAVRIDCAVAPDAHVPMPPAVVAVAIANLVKNALASPQMSAVRIEAQRGARDGAASTVLRVIDDGPGPRHDRPEPADDAHADRAHGFGLPIVEELGQRFGWTVTIAPRADGVGGTVATLTFAGPRADAAQDPRSA
ncbi:MAG: HAMP domain-containing sensor histidine kinase [Acidobacteriota bacterium]